MRRGILYAFTDKLRVFALKPAGHERALPGVDRRARTEAGEADIMNAVLRAYHEANRKKAP